MSAASLPTAGMKSSQAARSSAEGSRWNCTPYAERPHRIASFAQPIEDPRRQAPTGSVKVWAWKAKARSVAPAGANTGSRLAP
jgi:hypothetical protein